MGNVNSTYLPSMTDYNLDYTNIDLSTITISDSSITDTYISTITGISNIDTSLSVKGDSHFDGDLYVKGKNISESLDKIEQRLGILHVNKELETRWERLKQLADEYRALEQEILEKEKILDILKK